MDLFKRAQKLVAEMPRMTVNKMVDDSCSLIADLLQEVDRLDTECKERVAEKMEWLGERGTLQAEIKRLTAEVVATAAKLDECRNDRDKAEAENERLQSSLTLSREEGRREGMEQAAAIEQAIRDYHYALDSRQHGGVAENRAFISICEAMGLPWVQGEEMKRRSEDKGERK